MSVKYLVWPGRVRSKVDGDGHYLTAMQLISLYRVRPRDCIIAETLTQKNLSAIRARNPGIIDLYPRYNGNYTLPENTMENIVYNRNAVAEYIRQQVQEKAITGVDLPALAHPEGQSKFLLIWDKQSKCRVYIVSDINLHFSIPILDDRFTNFSIPLNRVPLENLE